LHLAAARGHMEVVEYLAPLDLSVARAADALGRSALDLARANGHVYVAAYLADPEKAYASEDAGDGLQEGLAFLEHQRLIGKWSRLLGPLAELPDPLVATLDIASPQVQSMCEDALELTCHIRDLESRLLTYVLEVSRWDGPRGAAPFRVYYARTKEQQKLDSVQFLVPRLRPRGPPGATALWEHGGKYRFRITGFYERCLTTPEVPGQVVSEWSEPVLLVLQQRGGAAESEGRRSVISRRHWPSLLRPRSGARRRRGSGGLSCWAVPCSQ